VCCWLLRYCPTIIILLVIIFNVRITIDEFHVILLALLLKQSHKFKVIVGRHFESVKRGEEKEFYI